MEKLKLAVMTAFDEADKLHQAGNASMQLVKLKLKEAAGHFSPALASDLYGKIGVGATTNAPAGRQSFAWTGPMPGDGKGRGKKPVAAALPASQSDDVAAEPTKGTVHVEDDLSLFVKIGGMKPTEIAVAYNPSTLASIAQKLGVKRQPDWQQVKFASEVRKAAKAKTTSTE